jgi:hypothetical protein
MIGKSPDNIIRAGAIGTMINASTYNRTIPLIFGTTRASLLATWAANIRLGASGKKAKKKGVQTYVENIDFLVGHNPLGGPLQFWDNANTFYPLAFDKYTTTFTWEMNYAMPPVLQPITVPDPDFYAVVAVTITESYSAAFDDYGAQGPSSASGTWEVPCWNAAFNGPDPCDTMAANYAPYAYNWIPGSGPTITLPFFDFGDVVTVNVYYAKTSPDAQAYAKSNSGSKNSTDIPIAANRLQWEPQLGDGSEFSGYTAQQIVYPFFAGMGSPDIDLGASGAIPNINAEIWGTFPVYPDPSLNTAGGDADFADMIVDILCSGPAQGGMGGVLGLTAVQHGCSCNNFPGIVQRKVVNTLSLGTHNWAAATFDLPVTKGSFLIAAISYVGGPSAPLNIGDSLGNSWGFFGGLNPTSGDYFQLAGGQTGSSGICTVEFGFNLQVDVCQMEIFEIAGFDSYTLTADTYETSDLATQAVTSATKRNQPGLLLNFTTVFGTSPPTVLAPAPRWTQVATMANSDFASFTEQRTVWGPVTLNVSHPLAASTQWNMQCLSFWNANPPQYPVSLGNILEPTTLANARLGARAGGLWGSININSAKKAQDILKDLYASMNAAPVYSGFQLKSIAWSEVSAAANGAIFVAPTASGPIGSIGPADFVGDEKTVAGGVERKAELDAPPILSMQHYDRANNYNQTLTSEPDPAGVSLFGVRKASPQKRDEIQSPLIARMLLGILSRRQVYNRNTFKYKVNATHALKEPMDLVLLSDPEINLLNVPVRITSCVQDKNNNIDMEFELFFYGVNAPGGLPGVSPIAVTGNTPYRPAYGADPGSVNTPIIFESVPMLDGANNQEELWIVLSSPSADYGGAQVYISTDGGVSYQTDQAWITQGSAITGYTVGDWPAHVDPDKVNNLEVDLTESNGELATYSSAEEDSFGYVFWVAGGNSTIPYELGCYGLATLTAPSKYTLQATGTGYELRRGVFAAPAAGAGVDHPNNSRFAFLGSPTQSNAPGIVRIPVQPSWVGTTLYFKFPAFNNLNSNVQSLDDCTPYTFAPTGSVGGINPYGLPPGLSTVNGS